MSNYEDKVGIIRAKEDNLLKRIDYERLFGLLTLRDLWNELVRLKVGYPEVPDNEKADNIEEIYSDNIVSLYKEVVSLLNEDELKEILLLEFDFFNIKLMFKEKILEVKSQSKLVPFGIIGIEHIKESFQTNIWHEYPKFLDEIIDILKLDTIHTTPRRFDILLDKILYKKRLKVSEDLNNDFMAGFFKRKIDLLNIKIFFEARTINEDLTDIIIPDGLISIENWMLWKNVELSDLSLKLEFYGYKQIVDAILSSIESSNMTLWEKIEEEYLMEYLKDSVVCFNSSEPILSYLFLRFFEIKNINRIVLGRAYNLNNEFIVKQISGI